MRRNALLTPGIRSINLDRIDRSINIDSEDRTILLVDGVQRSLFLDGENRIIILLPDVKQVGVRIVDLSEEPRMVVLGA